MTDNETIEFLKMYKRLHTTAEQEHWVFNPNSHLVPIMCDIRLKSYHERLLLVNNARDANNKLKVDPFGKDVKVFHFPKGRKVFF